MNNVLSITSADALRGLPRSVSVPPLESGQWAQDCIDMHLVLLNEKGQLQARCSLWWTSEQSYQSQKLGLIGHYASEDDNAAQELLTHACETLAAQGCSLAVGPLDGTTWKSYRFVTNRGEEPAFFLEPDNPDAYPIHFIDNGFHVLKRYSSASSSGAMIGDARIERVAQRLDRAGIRIRTLDPKRLDEELRAIHRLSHIAFQDSLLYAPISEEEFLTLYRPLLPIVQPEAILLAEDGDGLVGVAFTIPDMLQAGRGERVDTLILKTLVRMPGRIYTGLGAVLAGRCESVACNSLGYRRVIHALMSEGNASQSVSQRYAQCIREYALYGKALSP